MFTKLFLLLLLIVIGFIIYYNIEDTDKFSFELFQSKNKKNKKNKKNVCAYNSINTNNNKFMINDFSFLDPVKDDKPDKIIKSDKENNEYLQSR